MKKILILSLCQLFLIPVLTAGPEDTLRLEQCYQLSIENLPFALLDANSRQSEQISSTISRLAWYPNLTLNANASYQSDVTSIDIDMPGIDIPSPAKDQYGIYLEVRQIIYDAGLNKEKLNLELIEEKIRNNETVKLQKEIKQMVSDAFFGLLHIQSQIEVLFVAGKELDEQYKNAKALYDDGVIPKRSLLELEAARIAWQLQLTELMSAEATGLRALSILTGKTLDAETQLINEFENVSFEPVSIATPELYEFDLRLLQIETMEAMSQKQRNPKASLFGRLGYGRPGLNMLSDEFNEYYIVGAGITWSPWDWGRSKQERSLLGIQRNTLNANRDIYLKTMELRRQQIHTEMFKYDLLLQQTDTLISLRNDIREASSAALVAGSMTSTEYLADHNQYVRAIIQKQAIIIARSKSIANYFLLNE